MKNTYKKQRGGINILQQFYDYDSHQVPLPMKYQLVEAQKRCFPQFASWPDSAIFDMLFNSYTDLWILTDDHNNGSYVASASVNYNREIKNLIGFPPLTKESWINPDSLYNLIWNVCVADNYRNMGVCGILIRSIVQNVHSNMRPFALNVLKTNIAAKRCYRNNGFTKIRGCTDPENDIMVTTVKNSSPLSAARAPTASAMPPAEMPAFAMTAMPADEMLLQTLWKPRLAKKCQFSMEISRENAKDCTISSLAGLDFLNLDNAKELSSRIHAFNKAPSIELIIEFLSNELNIDVSDRIFNFLSASERNTYINQINNYLLANLKPLNATLITYSYINNRIPLAHALVIHRTIFNTIMVNDLQQGVEKLFEDFFVDDTRITDIRIFITRQNPNRMNIDIDLDKFVPPRGGKKYKSRKNKTGKKKSRKNKTGKRKSIKNKK